ncbi:hypothetical protein D3C81_1255240 [compost metagenome]
MNARSVRTRSQKISKLYELQKRLSIYNISTDKRAKFFFNVFLLNIFWMYVSLFFQSFRSLLNVIMFFISYFLFCWFRFKYVDKQFSSKYKHLFEGNIFKRFFLFKDGFIDEYRVVTIEGAFQTLNIPMDNIEDVIQIVEQDATHAKTKRCFPFSLLAFLTFPIWGEFIGFHFNLILQQASIQNHYEIETIKQATKEGFKFVYQQLSILSVALLITVLLFNRILNHLLFLDVDRKQTLVKTLRLIRISYNSLDSSNNNP